MGNILKAVQFMVDTANDDSHGYDQTNRNAPDYDCSSLVGTALHEAGFPVSKFSWTGNLESQLRKAGFKDCKAPWKAGDIHLRTGKHVVMSINEKQIAHASINEKGKITGGKTGDQTGKEICITNYYEYAGGWSMHLRYDNPEEEKPVAPKEPLSIDTIAREVIAGKWGNGKTRMDKLTEAGYNAKEVQSKVNALLKGKELKSNEEVAREVIKGKWGNGAERKKRLTEAGYNYNTIQGLVNTMLR